MPPYAVEFCTGKDNVTFKKFLSIQCTLLSGIIIHVVLYHHALCKLNNA